MLRRSNIGMLLAICIRDYRKLNADTINIYAPFFMQPILILNFVWLLGDPNGNCTMVHEALLIPSHIGIISIQLLITNIIWDHTGT